MWQKPLLGEDHPAGVVASFFAFLMIGCGHQGAEQRLSEAHPAVLDQRDVTRAIVEVVESLFEGRTAPVMLDACTIRHPGLWLWLRLWFCLRFWLWLGFWLWLSRRIGLFGFWFWLRLSR